MKIKFTKSIIENLLAIATNFTEKKDKSQITSHVLIIADENLIIKATDKEFGIEIKDNSTKILEKGKISINGKKLYEIIKTLNEEEITIESNEKNATISQNSSIYKLPLFNANEFPEFPQIENTQKININASEFIEGIKKIFPVIDINNPKYELNGALIKIEKENINIVSTDTKRLALFNIKNSNQKDIEIIIPRKAIAEIRKLFSENFEIFTDYINLILKTEKITFFTKLINGSFPNYKKIIPQSYKEIIKINKIEFTKKIRQIVVISNEIKFSINKTSMEIESISEENIEAKTELEITSNLENFVFAANSKFILDFLSVIEEDEFELCLNEANIPFTLRSKQFQTIIMPLNI